MDMRGKRIFAFSLVTLGVMLASLAPAGAQDIVWIHQLGTSSTDEAFAAATDGTNVYVAGRTFGTLPGQISFGSADAVLRRYDANGTVIWTRQFGSAGFDEAFGVAADGAGGAYIAASVLGDAFVRRYDANGTAIWTDQFIVGSSEKALAVATDGAGNVYVAGSTDGNLLGQTSSGGTDAFVRRYDASGTEIWTRQFGTAASDQALGVATDAGNVYVAGSTDGTLLGQTSSGGTDAFVRRYDASGTEIWTRQFGTAASDQALGVAADAAGNVFVAGTMSGFDAFVRRYDANGAPVWTSQFSTGAGASAVDADGAGNVYLAGGIFGALPGQTALGGGDAFIRRYDVNGAVVWSNQFGSAAFDMAHGVATDAGRNVFVVGRTNGSMPGNTSSGGTDAFAVRLLQRTCWDTSNAQGNETGLLSGPIHAAAEPASGGFASTLHHRNCTVVVPNGL
jgi:WD40 repeat protein